MKLPAHTEQDRIDELAMFVNRWLEYAFIAIAGITMGASLAVWYFS